MELRGSYPVRIDEKGRLKIPAPFQEELARLHSDDFWVTSPNGQYVWIYPMEEWKKVEERVRTSPAVGARRKFQLATSYFGQPVRWDKQGRLLIPSRLRDAAEIKGDVSVIGTGNNLTVWNDERFMAELLQKPLTDNEIGELDF